MNTMFICNDGFDYDNRMEKPCSCEVAVLIERKLHSRSEITNRGNKTVVIKLQFNCENLIVCG